MFRLAKPTLPSRGARRRARWVKSSLLGVLFLFGCGGATTLADLAAESDASSDSSAQTGPDVAVRDQSVNGRNPKCPSVVPSAGTPCQAILECEYASDPHHVCSTRADCAFGEGDTTLKWFLSPPVYWIEGSPHLDDGCGTNTARCPASFTALAEGSPCPGVSSFCYYQEGRCGCVPCSGEAALSSMLACRTWGPDQADCPAVAPLSGDSCSLPGQSCSYGGPCRMSVGATMVCQDGYWKPQGQIGSCIIPKCGAL